MVCSLSGSYDLARLRSPESGFHEAHRTAVAARSPRRDSGLPLCTSVARPPLQKHAQHQGEFSNTTSYHAGVS